jgi:hypothetical protein
MVFSGYNSILDIAIRVVMVLNKILVYGLSLFFLLSLSLFASFRFGNYNYYVQFSLSKKTMFCAEKGMIFSVELCRATRTILDCRIYK